MSHVEEIEKSAIDYAGNVHYQIYNGGFAQMMFNGYADGIEEYGYKEFLQKLSAELKEAGYKEDSKEYMSLFGAMSYVVNVLMKFDKHRECEHCGGSGYVEYEDEETDEDGDTYTTTNEEECDYCNGEGTYEVETFAECDGDYTDDYDSYYYSEFDGDVIDDVTEQSHNHSVFLDVIEKEKKEDK